jgi:maltooligosyltrehalose trehalohydrolase
LRFFAPGEDRLLLVNLGIDTFIAAAPEPLLAPLPGMDWRVLWSSEDPDYGGSGRLSEESADGWSIIGKSTCFFAGSSR